MSREDGDFAVVGVPVEGFPAGTNVLVNGDADAAVVATRLAGPRDGERSLTVTNRVPASEVVDRCAAAGIAPDRLGVLDCSPAPETPTGVATAATLPHDGPLRTLGERSMELVDGLDSPDGRVRFLFDSVTDLLDRHDLQDVYRFLHVYTDQVRRLDALGLYTADASTDGRAMRTLRRLFDYEVTVERGDDGPTVSRLQQLSDSDTKDRATR